MGPDGRDVAARTVLLAREARPAGLPGVAVDGVVVRTPDTLLDDPAPPGDVTIVGGGATGVGLAAFLAALGARVVLVTRSDRLLPRLDADIGAAVTSALAARGVAVHHRARLREVAVTASGFTAVLDDRARAARDRIAGTRLVVATGWRPATADLDLAATKAVLDKRGHVQVDAVMATAEPGLHAVGASVPTHDGEGMAAAEVATVLAHLRGEPTRPLRALWSPRRVPGPVPAFGVGLTAADAAAMGHLVGTGWDAAGPQDVVKVIVDGESGAMLGVQAAGRGAPALMPAAVAAMQDGEPAADGDTPLRRAWALAQDPGRRGGNLRENDRPQGFRSDRINDWTSGRNSDRTEDRTNGGQS
ncbi:NAD(P)/FAD-dependent oxidoreductase, partial [bacterium]|nr:NAD(P)/FAD-dependent oxidoreductase [bacterium]